MVWFSGGGDFKVSFKNCTKSYVNLIIVKAVKLHFLIILEMHTCISIRITENGYENAMSPSA